MDRSSADHVLPTYGLMYDESKHLTLLLGNKNYFNPITNKEVNKSKKLNGVRKSIEVVSLLGGSSLKQKVFI